MQYRSVQCSVTSPSAFIYPGSEDVDVVESIQRVAERPDLPRSVGVCASPEIINNKPNQHIK